MNVVPAASAKNVAISSFNWLSDPTSIGWLKAADFWMGVIGLALTFVTYLTARRAQKAAEGAKLRVKQYDVLTESAKSIQILNGIIQAVVPPAWPEVAISLSDIRYSLMRAELAVSHRDVKLSSRLKTSAGHLKKTILQIDSAQAGQSAHPNELSLKTALRKVHDNITAAQIVLQDHLI